MLKFLYTTAVLNFHANACFTIQETSEQADSVLSQKIEVRGQTRILRCEVVEGGRERGTRHLLNESRI